MSRAAGLCRRCGGPKKGRAARPSLAILQCYSCGDGICERHSQWYDDGYICTKCARKLGWKEYGIAQRRVSLPEGYREIGIEAEKEFPDAPEGGDAQ